MFEAAASTTGRVSHREIDRQLRRLAKADRELAIEIGRWFLIARRTEAHREFGYASFFEYVQRLFGMGVRAAEERVRVAEALETLPATAAALGDGVINFSVARDLTRIVESETEAVWLDPVHDKTAKEVRELVRGRERGDVPTDPVDPRVEPREMTLRLTPEACALFFEAKRALEDRHGKRLDDSEMIGAMCRDVLDGGDAGDGGKKAPYQVALSVCVACERTWQDTAGESIEVPPTVLEMARCDADWLGRVDGETPGEETESIPAAVRRQVVARDHHRCTVPGCRAFRALHIHHIDFQCHNGEHVPRNLTLLCTAHHTALHDGHLNIRGRAPHALHFTHADGRPYGSGPEYVCAEPPPTKAAPAVPTSTAASEASLRADAISALSNLGFKPAEARAAVERAAAHLRADASIEALVRESLRECARARRLQ